MTDLISRQAAIEAIRTLPHLYGNKEQRARAGGLADATMAIRDLPTIDAVPVVRCKDCKNKEMCRTWTIWAVPPPDDWFCKDGERSEEC